MNTTTEAILSTLDQALEGVSNSNKNRWNHWHANWDNNIRGMGPRRFESLRMMAGAAEDFIQIEFEKLQK